MLGNLTENEKEIIEQTRGLKPYESIEILADAQGKPDSFLIKRSHRVMLVINKAPQPIRTIQGKLQ